MVGPYFFAASYITGAYLTPSSAALLSMGRRDPMKALLMMALEVRSYSLTIVTIFLYSSIVER